MQNGAGDQSTLFPRLSASVHVDPPGSGLSGGTVQFLDTIDHVILASAALSSGVATATVWAKTAVHPHTAMYSGDASHAASESGVLTPMTVAGAAGYKNSRVPPDELVSTIGGDFANLAVTPAGPTVEIADSKGVTRAAPLFLMSAAQINIAIPGETALGPATVRVTSAAGITFSLSIPVTLTAPGLLRRAAEDKGWRRPNSCVWVRTDCKARKMPPCSIPRRRNGGGAKRRMR